MRRTAVEGPRDGRRGDPRLPTAVRRRAPRSPSRDRSGAEEPCTTCAGVRGHAHRSEVEGVSSFPSDVTPTSIEDRSRGPKPRTAARASCGFRPGFRLGIRHRCRRASPARLIRCCFAGVYCAKRSKRNKRHKSSEFPRRLIQTHFTDTCWWSRSSSTAPTRSQAGSPDPPIPRAPDPPNRHLDDRRLASHGTQPTIPVLLPNSSVCRRQTTAGRSMRRRPPQSPDDLPRPTQPAASQVLP